MLSHLAINTFLSSSGDQTQSLLHARQCLLLPCAVLCSQLQQHDDKISSCHIRKVGNLTDTVTCACGPPTQESGTERLPDHRPVWVHGEACLKNSQKLKINDGVFNPMCLNFNLKCI